MISDAISFGVSLQSHTVLGINIFFKIGYNVRCITAHPGSRTTLYFTKVNRVLEQDFTRLGSLTILLGTCPVLRMRPSAAESMVSEPCAPILITNSIKSHPVLLFHF